MRFNRKTVLIALAVMVIGSGALVGTGAFSSVEADRTVNINTAGDSNAQLALNITDSELEGSNGDTIAFNLSSDGVNLDATTRFNGALEITNNGDDDVDLYITDGSGNSLINSNAAMGFEMKKAQLNATETKTVDVVFNLTGTTSQSASSIPDSITIVANTTAP